MLTDARLQEITAILSAAHGRTIAHELLEEVLRLRPMTAPETCDVCGKAFDGIEQPIKTCTMSDYVTLCGECYKKAGVMVR